MLFYHFTCRERLPAILAEGLRALMTRKNYLWRWAYTCGGA